MGKLVPAVVRMKCLLEGHILKTWFGCQPEEASSGKQLGHWECLRDGDRGLWSYPLSSLCPSHFQVNRSLPSHGSTTRAATGINQQDQGLCVEPPYGQTNQFLDQVDCNRYFVLVPWR